MPEDKVGGADIQLAQPVQKAPASDSADTPYYMELQRSPTIINEYHSDAIRQSKLIVKNAIFMIWVGIALIIASFAVYAAHLTDQLLVGTLSGAFIDLFSATILYLFNKTDRDKQIFFHDLSVMENDMRILENINMLSDEGFKKEVLAKLVDKNFKLNRGK